MTSVLCSGDSVMALQNRKYLIWGLEEQLDFRGKNVEEGISKSFHLFES